MAKKCMDDMPMKPVKSKTTVKVPMAAPKMPKVRKSRKHSWE